MLEKLRAEAVFTLLGRVLLTALCGLAAWRSIRTAVADWVASAGTREALERAIPFAPDNPALLARVAMYKSDIGDPSPAVDEDLRHAARLNPFDSDVLMALGLREEFRGNRGAAEGYLVRATEIDHQFKPAWTLANYYYRVGQPDKAWPMIQRILSLDPLGFDPVPVYRLYWSRATGNLDIESRRILAAIPTRGHKPIQYLQFLFAAGRTDQAFEAFPRALAAADSADAWSVASLIGFVDFLAGVNRIGDAVNIWNQIVERGLIHYGRLNPAGGESIADSDFRFMPGPGAFGWQLTDVPGVSTSWNSGALRFDITGDEPTSFQALSTLAPVLPGTRYRLVWKTDGSSLNSPQDPGFGLRIVQLPGNATTQCPPLLAPGNPSCSFVSSAADEAGRVNQVRIDLTYARAQGTVRISGVLRLFDIHLEFAR